MDCSPLGYSVHGISQARILKGVAISFSRGLPDPGIEPMSSVSPALQADSLPAESTGKPVCVCVCVCMCVCVCVCVCACVCVYTGEGNGNPLQYSRLENSMERGSWQATVHGVTESDMTE